MGYIDRYSPGISEMRKALFLHDSRPILSMCEIRETPAIFYEPCTEIAWLTRHKVLAAPNGQTTTNHPIACCRALLPSLR